MKPKCKLVGADGNIFNLIRLAKKALNKADQNIQANEMTARVYEAESYDAALQIIMEYVDVE
ncbi:hypothetical protein [Marivirga sp.]|uniref:hypothetical protein n=1 Tax=Marivirga sp. TaxID=2018662 RepID=UPI0025E71A8B|nr:hypothetical protein [Marivirga sp.]